MATKKNPLSALLSADKRQQAEDFTRDHVTRSAVRQAGTYRVGVQQPLPITQTSLGRLSNSLGTVSGILNQFSQYQSKKEQAELKGESIETQTTLQGFATEQAKMDLTGAHIQGGIAHEAVKRQNIQLATMQQKASDAEYDNMRARMSIEEGKAHDARIVEDVRLTKRAQKAAELALVTGFPADFVHTPEFDKRARQGMGAAHYDEYKSYFATKIEEAVKGLPDHARAAYLKGPEAEAMMEGILTQFMEENGLDPDDEIGDGFLSSVHHFNEVQMPATSSQLMARSRELNLAQLTTAIGGYAAEHAAAIAAGKPPKDIQDMPWYIDLLAMDSPTQTEVLFHETKGVFAQMNRTLKGALGAELIFDALADTLTIGVGPDGKPSLMRDDGRFLGWQADIDEAITRAEGTETAKGESALNAALKKAKGVTYEVAPTSTQAEITQRTMGIVNEGYTVAEARTAFNERNKEYAEIANNVPDGNFYEFVGVMSREMRAIQADTSSQTNHLISSWTKNVAIGDTADGLAVVFKEVFGDLTLDETGDKEKALNNTGMRNFLSAYANGTATAGGIVDGKLTARTVTEFNEDTKTAEKPLGLLTVYRNDLDSLKNKAIEGLSAGYTNEELQEDFEAGAMALQDKLKADMVAFARSSVRERDGYLAAVTRENKNYEEYLNKRGLEASIPLDPAAVLAYAQQNTTLRREELQELALRNDKLNPNITPKDLSLLSPDTPEIAKSNIMAYAVAQATRQAKVDAYMDPKGELFQANTSLVSKLASRGLGAWQPANGGGWHFDGERNLYHKKVDGASAAFAELYKVSIPLADFVEIAGQYRVSSPAHRRGEWGPLTVPGSDTWLDAAETITFKPAYHTPTMDEMAWMQGEEYSPAGSTDRTTFQFSPFKTEVNGFSVIYDSDWKFIKKPITIDGNLLKDYKTPVIGIPFEGQPNADNLHLLIRRMGVTPEEFRGMHTFYGYTDGLSWVKSQYENSWYTNKRAIE